MAELGEFAQVSHTQIGEFARAHGIERLYATGALAKLAVESFGPGGQWFPDTQALSYALTLELGAAGPAVRVLVKGSRVNRLERVVDALVQGSFQPTGGH
jgi:UDP-N-acetylmuramoyl-tripeptide--D-alanyl-D-alanine ligase